jgi:hypothetical protein
VRSWCGIARVFAIVPPICELLEQLVVYLDCSGSKARDNLNCSKLESSRELAFDAQVLELSPAISPFAGVLRRQTGIE